MERTFLKKTWWAWILIVVSIIINVIMFNHPAIYGKIHATLGQLHFWHGDWILTLSRADVLWLSSMAIYAIGGFRVCHQAISIALMDERKEQQSTTLVTERERA